MGYRQTHADAGLGTISGVVASLPAGYTLGEDRQENGKKYRLVYNAGNSEAGPGYFLTPLKTGAGPYSLTVSTASKTHAHIGAVLVEHATATTGTFFWGLVRGQTAQGIVADVSSIATGAAFYIADNGQANLMPQSVVTGNQVVGINCTETATTGTLSGDPFIILE